MGPFTPSPGAISSTDQQRQTLHWFLTSQVPHLTWKSVGCTIPKKHGNFTSGPSRAFIWSRTGKKRWKLARWVSQQEILLWLHSDSFTECRDTAILQSPPKCHFAPQMPLYEKSSWKIEQILCLQWSETKWQIGGCPMFFGYCAPNWLSSQLGNLTRFLGEP